MDDEPLLVRPAQTSDADALIALWKSCDLSFDETRVAAELESCLEYQDGLIFVIASQSQIVASIWGTYDGRRGWIQRLATAPDQRGRGFAKRLVTLLEQRFTDIGCHKVNLLIEPDNSAVAAFYESLDYSTDNLTFMERFLSKAPKLTPRGL
ncbi:GNAT family N-acetyltransferase [Fodinicola feengrottensis]|uniref:GNAT family N-acetyltransferase n=1 Tax=Fodinicola feengrottensis TaxID=435914 RepID=UPI0013D488D9|nr:GNAT family N-acetyltransferase [Fodinicola feengrottensis]